MSWELYQKARSETEEPSSFRARVTSEADSCGKDELSLQSLVCDPGVSSDY